MARSAARRRSRASVANLQGFGIVFLHGKGAWPGGFDGGILSSLEDEGALVAKPEMPWSFHRRYGATYDQAMAEIDAAVSGLKAKGASRIVVIGHSLGANAAIGYAARHPDLAGVVALAPGHLPEADPLRSHVADAVARAKELIAAGQGNVPQDFPDMAQSIPLGTDRDACCLSQHFRSRRPGGDPEKCRRHRRGGAADAAPMGCRQARSDRSPRAGIRL